MNENEAAVLAAFILLAEGYGLRAEGSMEDVCIWPDKAPGLCERSLEVRLGRPGEEALPLAVVVGSPYGIRGKLAPRGPLGRQTFEGLLDSEGVLRFDGDLEPVRSVAEAACRAMAG